MWHPFTIAGAVDGKAVVPGFDAGAARSWTRAFCDLAPRRPVWALDVRGPLVAPEAWRAKAAAVARGEKALLVAAGSGLAPAVAFLRAVRRETPRNDGAAAPHVRLVAVVRRTAHLECLDAFCRPRNTRGDTAEPWLVAEVHATRAPKELSLIHI